MTFSTECLEMAMNAAIEQAQLAAAAGEFPYGAVVVSAAGEIVARAQDRVLRDNDPTRHAEIEAVRLAVRTVGPDLTGHALVSNVEPCAMCATAAWWARVEAIAYGVSQADLFRLRPDSMDEPGLCVEEAQRPFKRRMQVRKDVGIQSAKAVWLDLDEA